MNKKTAKKLLKKVVEDYNSISNDFDRTRKSDWKEFELFLPYIKNNEKIADLGCGNGRFYSFIKKHKKVKYIGIDNSENLLKAAAENTKEHNDSQSEKPLFIKGDLLELPLKDNEVDAAISIAAFHHIPSKKLRKKSIKEIHRTIKKNGTLIITAWNLFQPKYKKYIWKSRLKWLISLGKYDRRDTLIPWGKTGVKRYYYAFTQQELKSLLEKAGFKIIKEHIDRNFTYICKKK